ncbi:YugN-like family protein [Alteribacillus sp. HJP-4]|uniref:YugN-like family protein n=1 Tax=Alteribacillus sp. HJP-4 TaxID=2775394 RepID=UPI0035CD365F
MKQVQSRVENHQFVLYDLEKKLKPLGYVIGSGWDYDHGSFDYRMANEGEYHFFRIPFKAIDGELEQKGVKVELGCPFLLTHKYEDGIDEEVTTSHSLVDQFAEPEDKDAEIPQKYIDMGKRLNKELEETLLH